MALQDLGHALSHCICKQQLVQTAGSGKWGDPVQSHHSHACHQTPSGSAQLHCCPSIAYLEGQRVWPCL